MRLPDAGRGGEAISSGLEAAAGGSFTYVALLEVLPPSCRAASGERRHAWGQTAMLAVGFGCMALLALLV